MQDCAKRFSCRTVCEEEFCAREVRALQALHQRYLPSCYWSLALKWINEEEQGLKKAGIEDDGNVDNGTNEGPKDETNQ